MYINCEYQLCVMTGSVIVEVSLRTRHWGRVTVEEYIMGQSSI